MSEGDLDFKLHYIKCPRFHGCRSAAACVLFDRYKICRRRCKSLEAHLKKHPELTEKVKGYLEKRKEKKERRNFLRDWKFFGKNLPGNKFNCKLCDFVARSERGLKIHMKRTHKK